MFICLWEIPSSLEVIGTDFALIEVCSCCHCLQGAFHYRYWKIFRQRALQRSAFHNDFFQSIINASHQGKEWPMKLTRSRRNKVQAERQIPSREAGPQPVRYHRRRVAPVQHRGQLRAPAPGRGHTGTWAPALRAGCRELAPVLPDTVGPSVPQQSLKPTQNLMFVLSYICSSVFKTVNTYFVIILKPPTLLPLGMPLQNIW